jgi:hypothetical protein
MKSAILIAAASVLLYSCGGSANNQHPSAKYEEKKASMEEMERDSPLKFLKITGSHRGNLINQTVVEGEVINKATLTTYKNIAVQVKFLDKEGGTLEKQQHTLDEVVKPGTTLDFKIKVKHVKETASVTLDVVGADVDK